MRPQPFRQHLLDPPAGCFGTRVVPTLLPELPPRVEPLRHTHPLPYTTFAESLFLLRKVPQRWQERAFPLGVPTFVGELIVSPEENQQQ